MAFSLGKYGSASIIIYSLPLIFDARFVTGRPAALLSSQVDDAITWPIILLLSIGSLLGLVFAVAGCLCCRRNKFTNVFDSPRNGVSTGQETASAQGSTHEFTMFPPPVGHSGSADDVRFDPLPNIMPPRTTRTSSSSRPKKPKPATFSNAVNRGLSVQDWFDNPYSNFPRSQVRYQQLLGSGWFGQVVEGEAQGIVPSERKVKVVVKILHEDATPTDQMYFLHEAKPFRDSDHPNVLKLLGKCLESDPFLVILEHCALKNLKSYLIERRGSAEYEAVVRDNFLLRAVNNIAAGLQYLHGKDFIHTDLACRNCLVASDGTVKIGDYGNSLELFKDDYYCFGGIAVPIRWCAPETLLCTDSAIVTREVTKHANIWSFGVVMWEVLEFGKLPYLELSDDEVVKNVIIENSHRLEQPRIPSPHASRIFRVSQACLADPRLPLDGVVEALSFLLTVPDTGDPSGDFEARWRRLRSGDPATLPSLGWDLCSSSRETSPSSWQQNTSVSLQNLRGSLEDVTTVVSSSVEDESLNLSLQVTRVIQRFDEMLLEDGRGDAPGAGTQEDLLWKRTMESNMRGSGDIGRLVREKSQSVQDFLKLTVVDSSESGSDTEPGSLSVPQQLSASDPTLDAVSVKEVKVKIDGVGRLGTAATTNTSPTHPGHALDGGGEAPTPPPLPAPRNRLAREEPFLSLDRWAGEMADSVVSEAVQVPSIRVHEATSTRCDTVDASEGPFDGHGENHVNFNFRFVQNDTEEGEEEEDLEEDEKTNRLPVQEAVNPNVTFDVRFVQDDIEEDECGSGHNEDLKSGSLVLDENVDREHHMPFELRFARDDAVGREGEEADHRHFDAKGRDEDEVAEDEDGDPKKLWFCTSTPLRDVRNVALDLSMTGLTQEDAALGFRLKNEDESVSREQVLEDEEEDGRFQTAVLLGLDGYSDEDDDEILMVDVETNEAVLMDSPRSAALAAKAAERVPSCVVEEPPSTPPSVSSGSLSLLWSPSDVAEWGSEASLRNSGASSSWLVSPKEEEERRVTVEDEGKVVHDVTYALTEHERTFIEEDVEIAKDDRTFTADDSGYFQQHALSTVLEEVTGDFDQPSSLAVSGPDQDLTRVIRGFEGDGEGDEEDHLDDIIADLHIGSHVALLSVDDVAEVAPTEEEGAASMDASESGSVWWQEEEGKERASSEEVEAGQDGRYYAADWESESDSETAASGSGTSSSSTSGEFFCSKTRDEEQDQDPLRTSGERGMQDGRPQTDDLEPADDADAVRENGEVEDCYDDYGGEDDGEDGERGDDEDESIKVSTWDRNATPSKSLLRSPEKRSDEKKSVSFKTQTRKVIYKYPREEIEEERYFDPNPQQNFWMMMGQDFDYNIYADWVLEGEELPDDMVDVDDLEDLEDLDPLAAGPQPWEHRPLSRTDDQTQAHALYRLGGMTADDEEEEGDYGPVAQGGAMDHEAEAADALAFYDSHEAYNLAALLARYGAEGTEVTGDGHSGSLTEEEMWLEAILNAGNFYVSGTDSPFDFYPGSGDMADWQGEGDGETDAGRRRWDAAKEAEVSLEEETGEVGLEEEEEDGDEPLVFEPALCPNGDMEEDHAVAERFREYDGVFKLVGEEVEREEEEELGSGVGGAYCNGHGVGTFQNVKNGESVSKGWNGAVVESMDEEGTSGEGEMVLAKNPGQQVQLGCSNARSVESTA